MDTKFIAFIIFYIIIASTACTFITLDNPLNLQPSVDNVYNFTTNESIDDTLSIVGNYKINETYGIYTDSIIKVLGAYIGSLQIVFPVRYNSDTVYDFSFHVYNPNNENYWIIYAKDAFSDQTVDIYSDKVQFFSGLFGNPDTQTLEVDLPIEYDVIIRVNPGINTITTIINNKEYSNAIDEITIGSGTEASINTKANYIYFSDLKVSASDNSNEGSTNWLSQFMLLLTWNVSGNPWFINIIFIKVPLLILGIAIAQMARGN